MKTTSRLGARLLDVNLFARVSGSKKEFAHAKSAAETIVFVESKNPKTRQFKDGLQLYEYLFPDPDEAEPRKVIISRLKEMQMLASDQALQQKYGDSRFHAILALSGTAVVGYTQFSTMPVANDAVCVFWQYGGVADSGYMFPNYGRKESFRRTGVASTFFLLRHGIASEDASQMTLQKGVVGTICEAEFIGQAEHMADILFTKTRLHIHRQMGSMAIMLDMGKGQLVTAHLQPRLDPTSDPILLHMLFRPLRVEGMDLHTTQKLDLDLARALVMSYIDNFDREGFDPADVESARQTLKDRFTAAKRVLLIPPEKLPNMIELSRMDPLLKEQTERKFGSLNEQEARIRSAFRS